MEINNTITLQASLAGSSRPSPKVGRPSSSFQEGPSLPEGTPSAGGSGAPVVMSLSGLASTSYIKEQLETIMYSFPPFFPAGSPQRIDLIKGVRGVQEEIGKSVVSPEVKQKLTTPTLTDHATDQEVAAALKDIKQYKETLQNRGVSPAPEKGKADTKVSLKI